MARSIRGGRRRSQGRPSPCAPYADQVEQGDSTLCDGKTGDGKKVSVLVIFNSDRNYIWEQQ